ncbi:MAG TPA: acetyl-CoA carboxylase biotin carboxylase subunit [Ramlibacter sp.]|uniref:acetyl-CoA carboxylase biotin carboxylase subunit n=1 Tax=Ramlibacter sp. TaxID=1917967 RepID=UPI002B781194|nr:acetyl-CoA carboxylase biotin carboxylase subunit [Ramlibacter sp.]HVZ45952.1 acetyl-CoA carboxylase biotin carboxylase subunit [Ramlibacter sp.]
MIKRLLIANRGEIALRVVRACRELGIESVAVYSDADSESLHVKEATMSLRLGPPAAKQSYLNKDLVIHAAKVTGADAIHPGYGFLSEDADFAERCAQAGLAFVGPPADAIRRMGDKIAAKQLAASIGVPLVPGGTLEAGVDLEHAAKDLSYPVLLKAAAGGGGRGMRIVREASEFAGSVRQASNEALEAFGNGTVYWESYIGNARHIEVQVFSDSHGHHIHLGERDCTLQRRHQKLLEESPSPMLSRGSRSEICECAVRIVRALDYRGAGTIEFLFDADRGSFHFIEMNTRIQVEHPVTEEVHRIDLVREQLRVASGEPLSPEVMQAKPEGWAIECRINAEDSSQGFMPSPGRITRFAAPGGPGVRVETHCETGSDVSPWYDSMIAKLIVWDRDRERARLRMLRALGEFHIEGVETTIPFHIRLLASRSFIDSAYSTRWVETAIQGELAP